MEGEGNKTPNLIYIIVSIVGGLILLLINLRTLDLCTRVLIIIGGIALITATLILIKLIEKLAALSKLQATPEASFVDSLRYLRKSAPVKLWLVIALGALAMIVFILAVFPETQAIMPPCRTAVPTPLVSPTPVYSLLDARVDFMVTFKDGRQVNVPAGGSLTLSLDDKVVLKASTTTTEGTTFSHDLLTQFYFSSGGKTQGDTAPYVARKSGEDIITVWIKDEITNDEIYRSIDVMVK